MIHRSAAVVAAFLSAIVGLSGGAWAGSGWPQFGYGAGHTAYNPGETVINSGNVASLIRIATLTTPGEISDPVIISDGIAYANSIGSNTLYAFDVATGQQRWTFPGTNLDSARGIAVAGGRVFVTCEVDSQHWGLCALKAGTGKLQWSWANQASYPSSPQSPPAVSGDVVYFEEYQTYGDWLTALDTTTGTVLWQFGYCQVDGVCDALGPNAPAIDGGMIYVGCNLVSGLQGVCAVNASNGQLAWAAQLGGQPNGTGYSWGDAGGNLIANRGVVYANYMTMNCNNCSFTSDVVALDETTGATIWDKAVTAELNGVAGPVGPPALHGRQVIANIGACDASNDGCLVSLSTKAGHIQWRSYTGNYWLNSSPSLVSDLIFAECYHGGGTICAYHTTDGSMLWNSPDSGDGGTTWQAPAITGGVAYEVCGYNDVCLYTPQ